MTRKEVAEPLLEQTHTHAWVSAFVEREFIDDGLHSVQHASGEVSDIVVADRGADVTIVTFNGAAAEGARRPYFQGKALLDDIERRHGPVNRVHVHDALLKAAPNLRIGWYLGTPQLDLAHELTQLLKRILRQLGRGPVILFGSSAGGFAALTQGEALPDTVVVAVNPQVSLERYEPSLYRRWLEKGRWIEPGTPLPRPSEVAARTELWSNSGPYTPRHTYLLLNVNDDLHVHSHVLPWLESWPDPRPLTAVLGSTWGPSHTPAPRTELGLFLGQLLMDLRENRDTTDSCGLGEVVHGPTATGLRGAIARSRQAGTPAEVELDLRGRGVRFALRDLAPGRAVTINAGLRASGTHLLRSFLVSVEAEKDGVTYTKPIRNAVWSSDPLVHHFAYLPLKEGHTRYIQRFIPPSDVAIVAVRLCQWTKSSPASVFLTDLHLQTQDS